MGLLKIGVHMKALFPSKLEVLGSFFYFFFSLFFASLKPDIDLGFYSKSYCTEVCIVYDLFWREEGNSLVPHEASTPRALTLVFLFWTWFLKTYIIVSKSCIQNSCLRCFMKVPCCNTGPLSRVPWRLSLSVYLYFSINVLFTTAGENKWKILPLSQRKANNNSKEKQF